MPRRDGLPTNHELLTAFEEEGRELFAEAYVRTFEHIPDAFHDKPFVNLRLELGRTMFDAGISSNNPMVSERVEIQPASFVYDQHLRWRSIPGEIISRQAIVEQISGLAINQSLDIPSVPPKGLRTEYQATFLNDRRRVVATDNEKPVKQTIVSGRVFIAEALAYVMSDQYDPARTKLLHPPDPDDIYHQWNLDYDFNLPITGFEPEDFLSDYYSFLDDSIRRLRIQKSRISEHQFDFVIRGIEYNLQRAEAKIAAVSRILFGA